MYVLLSRINSQVTAVFSTQVAGSIEITDFDYELIKSMSNHIAIYKNKTLTFKIKKELVDWTKVREKRKALFEDADNRIKPLEDSERLGLYCNPQMLVAISQYRQNLRDITSSFSSPDDVNWPIKPWAEV